MDSLRFGIIGSGFMGRTHAEAIRRLPNAVLISVWGGSRASALAETMAVHCEDSLERMLARDDIDAVVVTTPHHLHVDQAILALKAGRHVLVEKPLATTVADCDLMIAAAKASARQLAVGYQQRFRVNNLRAKELITTGAIGKLLTAQVSMPMFAGAIKSGGFGGNWAWWNDRASIGHLINSAPHALDLLRWFTGADVTTVSAFSRTFLSGIEVEDTTLGLLEFSSGMICSLYSSRALPAPSFPGEEFRFRLVGTTGLLDLDPYGQLRLSDSKGWQLVSEQPAVKHEGAATAFGDIRIQAYRDQLAAMITAIRGEPSQVGTALDGRAAVTATLAMMESSAQRKWVELSGPVA